jgi:hypothetical protein
MELLVNINFKNLRGKEDSLKRSEHLMDRMISRGIFISNIKEAIRKGAKKLRNDGSVIVEYRWFRIIYREFKVEDVRKIYPITVMEV